MITELLRKCRSVEDWSERRGIERSLSRDDVGGVLVATQRQCCVEARRKHRLRRRRQWQCALHRVPRAGGVADKKQCALLVREKIRIRRIRLHRNLEDSERSGG